MLANVLALAVALGSIALYLTAFTFPTLHRKQDFAWSGVGLFYALVLWVCSGRITGAVLLGQTASVALLGWFGWQMLLLRSQVASPDSSQRPNSLTDKLLIWANDTEATGILAQVKRVLAKAIASLQSTSPQGSTPASGDSPLSKTFSDLQQKGLLLFATLKERISPSSTVENNPTAAEPKETYVLKPKPPRQPVGGTSENATPQTAVTPAKEELTSSETASSVTPTDASTIPAESPTESTSDETPEPTSSDTESKQSSDQDTSDDKDSDPTDQSTSSEQRVDPGVESPPVGISTDESNPEATLSSQTSSDEATCVKDDDPAIDPQTSEQDAKPGLDSPPSPDNTAEQITNAGSDESVPAGATSVKDADPAIDPQTSEQDAEPGLGSTPSPDDAAGKITNVDSESTPDLDAVKDADSAINPETNEQNSESGVGSLPPVLPAPGQTLSAPRQTLSAPGQTLVDQPSPDQQDQELLDRCMDATKTIIVAAQQEATKFGSEEIRPEDLLLGFLCVNNSNLAFGSTVGISLDQVYQAFETKYGQPQKGNEVGKLKFSSSSRRILEVALSASQGSSNNLLHLAQLLLTLVQADDDVSDLLKELKVDLDNLRDRLQGIIESESSTTD